MIGEAGPSADCRFQQKIPGFVVFVNIHLRLRFLPPSSTKPREGDNNQDSGAQRRRGAKSPPRDPPSPGLLPPGAVRVGVAGIALPGDARSGNRRPGIPSAAFRQQEAWSNAAPGGGDDAAPRTVLSNVTKAGASDAFAGGLRS